MNPHKTHKTRKNPTVKAQRVLDRLMAECVRLAALEISVDTGLAGEVTLDVRRDVTYAMHSALAQVETAARLIAGLGDKKPMAGPPKQLVLKPQHTPWRNGR